MLSKFLIRAKHPVAPRENARVRPFERLVMEIVVHRATPKWNQICGIPRHVVARVILHRFHEPEKQPNPQRHHVLGEKQRPEQRADAQKERLHRVRVLGGDAERKFVLVMNLVHVLVHPLMVQSPVNPVKVEIFNREKHRNLPQQIPRFRQRLHRQRKSKVRRHEIKHHLHRQLNEHVRLQKLRQALHHHFLARRFIRLYLPSLKVFKLIHRQPRRPRAEVHRLVVRERQRTRDDERVKVIQHDAPNFREHRVDASLERERGLERAIDEGIFRRAARECGQVRRQRVRGRRVRERRGAGDDERDGEDHPRAVIGHGGRRRARRRVRQRKMGVSRQRHHFG